MNANLNIEETLDWEAVWRIAQDPAIYDRICDDNWSALPVASVRLILKRIVENPHNHVLLVLQDVAPVGAFILFDQGDGLFEVHTLLSAACRGKDAIRAGKLGMQFALNLPGVEKLISLCPANLPETYLFARYCGWHKAGVAACKWLKNGIEFPMRIVEATRKDLLPA